MRDKEKARSRAGKDFRGDKHEIEVILLAIFRETLIYIKHVSGPLKISVFQRYSQQDQCAEFFDALPLRVRNFILPHDIGPGRQHRRRPLHIQPREAKPM